MTKLLRGRFSKFYALTADINKIELLRSEISVLLPDLICVFVRHFLMKGIDWDLGWSASSGENMLLEVLQNKFWSQLVREPTHVEGNTLDIVIPSSTELVANVEVLGYLGPGCDHNMILTYLVGPARD